MSNSDCAIDGSYNRYQFRLNSLLYLIAIDVSTIDSNHILTTNQSQNIVERANQNSREKLIYYVLLGGIYFRDINLLPSRSVSIVSLKLFTKIQCI